MKGLKAAGPLDRVARENAARRIAADECQRRRQQPAPERPAFPWLVHEFEPMGMTQCARCFGWCDDPRHWTPMS